MLNGLTCSFNEKNYITKYSPDSRVYYIFNLFYFQVYSQFISNEYSNLEPTQNPWAYLDLINQKWLKLSGIRKCKQKHEDKLGFLSNEGDSIHMLSH